MTSRSRRWNGNDLDTCADDLATLVKMLDLKNAGAMEVPLFGQCTEREACKYDQKHNGGGGGKFVVTLLHKDSKHKDHAQDRTAE